MLGRRLFGWGSSHLFLVNTISHKVIVGHNKNLGAFVLFVLLVGFSLSDLVSWLVTKTPIVTSHIILRKLYPPRRVTDYPSWVVRIITDRNAKRTFPCCGTRSLNSLSVRWTSPAPPWTTLPGNCPSWRPRCITWEKIKTRQGCWAPLVLEGSRLCLPSEWAKSESLMQSDLHLYSQDRDTRCNFARNNACNRFWTVWTHAALLQATITVILIAYLTSQRERKSAGALIGRFQLVTSRHCVEC